VIKNIILTADYQENRPVDYVNLSTDVIVHFENGDRYVAPFFSYENLKDLMEIERRSKEFQSGEYYKVLNIVLVKDFNSGNLFPVIECMMSEGDFQLIFKKL
jgi:hypothetical protein